jgi:hypothetical protein
MPDTALEMLFNTSRPTGTYKMKPAKMSWMEKAPPTVRKLIARRFSENNTATANSVMIPNTLTK